ncbi:MAG: hypothetical protein HQM10_23615 [Candidatus Riflebacteria bacterium]|nr:hypothetical protein [Candidatus Riflebacteria bacterium]
MRSVKIITGVMLLMFMFLFVGFVSAASNVEDARRMLEQGKVGQALEVFTAVQRESKDPAVLKEAKYFTGFCKIRLQDYWGGIKAFESFLEQYEAAETADSKKFVPDALYVLGKAYEQVDKKQDAIDAYCRCITMFPKSEYATKSREQVSVFAKSSKELDQIIAMAKASNYYTQQDKLLADALSIAKDGWDVAKLAQACYKNDAGDDIILQGLKLCRTLDEALNLAKVSTYYNTQAFVCLNSMHLCRNGMDAVKLAVAAKIKLPPGKQGGLGFGQFNAGTKLNEVCMAGVSKCQNIDEIIALSKVAADLSTQDKILLSGVKFVKNLVDVTRMASTASDPRVTKKIQEESKKYLPKQNINTVSIQMSVQTMNPEPVKAISTLSDPFENHTVDREKISRVEKFVSAINKNHDLKLNQQLLKAEDMSLDIIRDSIKIRSEKKSFDGVHSIK